MRHGGRTRAVGATAVVGTNRTGRTMGGDAMRMMISLMCEIAAIYAAADDSRLHNMLASAATNRGSAYLEARTEILAPGTNALPALGRCAVETDLTWQQRLVARICYERLSRGADIAALWAYDWRTDKGYDKQWERHILGPTANLGKIVVPKCREVGLWYYYVELTWKETGELPVCGKCLKPLQEYTNPSERYAELARRAKEGLRACLHGDPDFGGRWPHWCLDAVSVGPERYWYRQTVAERMLGSPFSAWHLGRYQNFLKEKDPETVPLLVQMYDSKRQIYPSNRDDWYREGFLQIMAFADSRHVDLLEKYISEKPALEPLKTRLAEVRARPAPLPVTEPPFRLGTNSVMIVP
jgi:hypothetical protein